ncbi:MAG: hypothetical protein IT310_03825 [Anaerolineales bacterium]|nr:hypothetical protein [Anaerolineales bacterium]
MSISRNRRSIWRAGLALFALACALPAGLVPPPTPTVESLSQADFATIVAGTANAAGAQTASALPTATRTYTPTWTPSLTPTPTPTFLFLIPTRTPIPTDTVIPTMGTLVILGSGTAPTSIYKDVPWACLVTGSTPPRNAPVKPGKDFYVTWTVKNVGTKEWWNNGIDFIYDGGYRTEQRAIQDLPKTVYPGGSVTLKVLLIAPKRPDSYNVIWALRVGNKSFCHLKITFKVAD